MPEILSRYQLSNRKTLPTLYHVPSVYGKAVLVSADEYKTDTLPKPGGAHRINNPNNPNTYPFKALSMEDTGIMKPFRSETTDRRTDLSRGAIRRNIRQDRGRPSWKRNQAENWWVRNQHTVKPHAIAVGIGLVLMVLALILADVASAHAAPAPLPSTAAGTQLDMSNWLTGSAQGGPHPAPMPQYWETPLGKLQICRILDQWNWGLLDQWNWGPSAPGIRTLELRLDEQRCALKNIPVGSVSEANLPGE